MLSEDRTRFFWSRVQKTESCWSWTGAFFRAGYGVIVVEKKHMSAHRYSFLLQNGYLPKCIDHVCRNRACVNPTHLEDVSQRENVLRGDAPAAKNARKSHCKRGHLLAGENLRLTARGHRACKTCQREVLQPRTNAHNRNMYWQNREKSLERMRLRRERAKAWRAFLQG